MNYNGSKNFEGDEPPKREKKKGIRGRSDKVTIDKRQRLIHEILSDKNLEEYTEQKFKAELRSRCNELRITYPSNETIRTDLIACEYKLIKGKFLKRSIYDPLSIEMLQYLFKESLISRLTVQIKSDEYVLLPIIQPTNLQKDSYDNKESTAESDESVINTHQYFEGIYSCIENNYNSLATSSINLTFSKSGYEVAISQLLYDIAPETILSFSANTYGVILYSTVNTACSLLELLYNCLPNTLDILEVSNSKQPF